ncbi:MAG: hypothetical protein HY912_16415 [Desulfomonile tiedjei]|uniref:Uncharacterized protein n=1 Tax=Desulfomonile tiedjei TaxID=2358 RepID=A0A9D6V5G3_9BACT|nr:hypothetical protein [Desulfomonile tiedjei]
MKTMTGDVVKLLPRALGNYIYQNRHDYFRGVTFALRNVLENPGKQLDVEEVRTRSYERLMRDIPFCIEALKGGELKLDTNPGNISARLGMIAYNTLLASMPAFPDLKYFATFGTTLAAALNDNQIDIWLYYDGYGDFHSLGELMERLRPQDMPSFTKVRNEAFATALKEDIFAVFRAPQRFDRHIVMTDTDINAVYSTAMNNILDVFMYIWKCSGMDMAHPSYSAPPGTIISRPSRRRVLSGGILSKLPPPIVTPTAAASTFETGGTAETSSPSAPPPAPFEEQMPPPLPTPE